MLFDFSRQPYLEADTGANPSGGEPSPAPEQNPGPEPAPEPQGGNEPAPEPKPQTFKVKYNHEERELTLDEAIQYAQKGMNYDHVYSELEQLRNHPGALWLQNQAKRYGMSVDDYIAAVQQQEEEEKLNELVQQNIPEEYAKEMLENRRFREQFQAEKKAREEAERRAKEEKDFISRRNFMYEEFMNEFPDYADPEKAKSIPKEVWAEADKWLKSGGREGRRLTDALTRYNWRQTMAQQQASEANQANANASTGSVKGQAKSGTFFTREQVAAMSREEIRANYNAIKESEKRWK
jgi:hypothetical protein